MAEQTKKMVPKIRFKGFSEEWVEKALGKVYKKIRNAFVGTATPYYVSNGFFYLESNNVKNGVINRRKEVFINEYFYMQQKDNWLHVGDIVMVQSGHVGHSAVIPKELNNTAAHALIIIANPIKETDSHFINYQFQTQRCIRQIENITIGNTIKHILSSGIKKYTVCFSSAPEQFQIGTYFQELDQMIGLHQQKHEKLVTLKKAMLQKMFPQNGTTTPEIRFKGFSKPWEEKKIGEICDDTYGGGTPRTSEVSFWNGRIAWIQSSDLTIDQLTNVTPRKSITEDGLRASATKLIPENSIAIVTRVGVGKLAFMTYKYATSQDFLSLSKLRIDPWFAVYSIWGILQNKLHTVQGTSIKGLTKEELLLMQVVVPKQEVEQQKIGTYFRQLDELIAQHGTQVEKLKQIKTACLEKMFV